MKAWKRHSEIIRSLLLTAYWFAILLFCTTGRADAASQAELPAATHSSWGLSTQFYLAGSTHFQKIGSESFAYEVLANTLELELSSPRHPYSFSLFADYRLSTASRSADLISMGGMAYRRMDRWDISGFAFASKATSGSADWFYATRVRYQLAENHKVGVETMGLLRDMREPKIMLGYYFNMSKSLSAKLLAGSGTGSGRDISARAELVWSAW